MSPGNPARNRGEPRVAARTIHVVGLALARTGNSLRSLNAYLCFIVLVSTASVKAQSAQSDPVQTDVFVSGESGYHTYRIPALVVTTNCTLLAFCEGRKNSGGDSGDIDLLFKRSVDGGKTWSGQLVIWSDGANCCGNPAPVVDQTTGVVWLLLTWNLGSDKEDAIGKGLSKDTRRVYVTHSADDGVTWAKPAEITRTVKLPDWHWYATGPVNGIQLTRGPQRSRLVVPANHSFLIDKTQTVSRSHIIFSDDHGATWQIGGSEEDKTNESTIVERADGSLLHNMRSYHQKNRRAIATSRDGGQTWSPLKHDDALIEPVCQASILRCTWPEKESKSRILFSNPASLKRENLSVRLSYDEGETWPVSKSLWAGPAAYSCLAVLPNKLIACLYERGDKKPYEKISLTRFSSSWLESR